MDTEHNLGLEGPVLTLNVMPGNHDGQQGEHITQIAFWSGLLRIDGQSTPITTDADGRVKRDIPVNAHEVKLIAGLVEYQIQIGDLDPVSKDCGLLARLNNLGYYIGNLNEVDTDDRFALALFQLDSTLDVNGEARPEVLAKLVESHGC